MGVLKDDHLTYYPETAQVSGWYVKWSSFKTPILAGPRLEITIGIEYQ